MFSEIVWTNKKEEEIDINEVFKSNAKMSYDASKDILVVYGDLIIEGNIEFQSELLVLGNVTVKSKKSKELSEEELLAVLSGALSKGGL